MLARIGEVCPIDSACTFQCALSVIETCESCTQADCISVCNMIMCSSLLQCCAAAENFGRDCLGASEASQAAHAIGTQRSAAFATLRIAPASIPLLAQFASCPLGYHSVLAQVWGYVILGVQGGEAAGSYGSAFILLSRVSANFPKPASIFMLPNWVFVHPAVNALSVPDLPACRKPKMFVLHMCQNGRQE